MSYKDITSIYRERFILGMKIIVSFLITSPAVGFVIPEIILIDELLPAPLGPSNPKISPERESLISNLGTELS